MNIEYRLLIVILCFLNMFFISNKADAFGLGEERTANRNVLGIPLESDILFKKQEHYEFSPNVSNWNIQQEFPPAWDNQDWEKKSWNKEWSATNSLKKLFEGNILKKYYIKKDKIPVLELGPVFYKLSDLDRRRSVKLFVDESDIFNAGYNIIELVDWSTHEIVGSYTKQGILLN